MQWIEFQRSQAQRLQQRELDAEQTQAKNFSVKGQALVRGVAGSGKSLVLRDRVEKILAEQLEPVLVLSYNRFMKGWTQAQLTQKKLRVECDTFHRWGWHRLGYSYTSDRQTDLRQKVVDLAGSANWRYQAILVDEAQDFYDEWFQALLEVLDRETNSLFLVYDNTQSIYGQAHRRKSGWSWAQLGIDVRGRSQIFDLNYRNSPEILTLAWTLIQPALAQAGMKVERKEKGTSPPPIDRIIEPKTKRSRSSGVAPLLLQRRYDATLATEIAQQVNRALMSAPKSSIGILTPPQQPQSKTLRAAISQALQQLGIKHHAPQHSGDRFGNVVDQPYVILDSWNALKGVEFDAVILVGIDWIGAASDPDLSFAEQAGLYTAMTRARDHLILLYETKTAIVAAIEAALQTPMLLRSED